MGNLWLRRLGLKIMAIMGQLKLNYEIMLIVLMKGGNGRETCFCTLMLVCNYFQRHSHMLMCIFKSSCTYLCILVQYTFQ